MAIEYLDNAEEQNDAPHEHHCEECGTIIVELCTDDCDDDTFEICQNCKEILESDESEMNKAINNIKEEKE